MTSPESDNLPEPQTIPLELGGKWIAWSTDCLRIIASGDTLHDCEQAAKKTNEHDPCFQKAPPADIRILGAAR